MIPGWRIPEINHVRMWASTTQPEVLARQIRKPLTEVEQVIQKLNLKPAPKPIQVETPKKCGRPTTWNPEYDAELKRLYATTPNYILADKFGQDVTVIRNMAGVLGLRKANKAPGKKFWTEDRVVELDRLWNTMSTPALASYFGCSKSTLCLQAFKMGLRRNRKFEAKDARYWTDAQDDILRKHYATTDTQELIKLVNKSRDSIHNRASMLGLRKSAEAIFKAKSRVAKSKRNGIINALNGAIECIGTGDAGKAKEMINEALTKFARFA